MRRGSAALLVVAALLGGCSGATGTSPDAPELSARLERSRLFELERQLKLVVHATGDEPVAIESLQLDSPLFAPVAAQQRRSDLEPDETVSIPIAFGEAVCDQSAEDVDEPPAALLTIDGAEQRVALDQHPADALAALNARECETARILGAADLGFGDETEQTGPFEATTTLDLELVEDGAIVTVDEVRSSVVFTVALEDGGGPPILEVGPEQALDQVGVTFTASRCDGHALTESKKTFVFPAWIHLDGGPATKVELRAEGELRALLEGFLEQCLANPPGS